MAAYVTSCRGVTVDVNGARRAERSEAEVAGMDLRASSASWERVFGLE